MKLIVKPAHSGNLIFKSLFIVLCILLVSCRNSEEEDTKMHEIDKKYLTESELFALNQAIEEDPDEPDYYYKRAKIYLERNDDQKALKDIREAIRLKNNEGKLFYLKALIFYSLRQPDSALAAAKNAESLNVNTAEIKLFLSRLYLERGNKELAQKYLSDAETLTPYHPETYFIKGKLKALDGDTMGALVNYFTVLKKDTLYSDAYKELAAIYTSKHKYDSALVFIATGKGIDPEEPFFELEEGKILDKLNLKAASKAFYFNALQLDSVYPEALKALGNLYYAQGNEKDAQTYFEKELAQNPDDEQTNIQLAQIYEKQNRGDRAIGLLERVLKNDSTNKSIKKDLEKLYLAYPDKKPKEAVDTVKKEVSTLPPVTVNKQTVDTATKIRQPAVIKRDTTKKSQPLTKPDTTKPLQQKEPKKENKISVPKIKNPDSLKIEKRPDSLSR